LDVASIAGGIGLAFAGADLVQTAQVQRLHGLVRAEDVRAVIPAFQDVTDPVFRFQSLGPRAGRISGARLVLPNTPYA